MTRETGLPLADACTSSSQHQHLIDVRRRRKNAFFLDRFNAALEIETGNAETRSLIAARIVQDRRSAQRQTPEK